jgi:phage-related protein (TIGR01555 family)
MTRWELAAQDLILDPLSPYFGEPSFYSLGAGDRAGITIHPSRIIRFVGRPIPRFAAGAERWGDSELQVIDDALKQAGVSLAQVATLFNEAKTDIISVPGLTSILATQEGTDRLTSRFANAALLKSAHNVLLLQGGDEASAEKWETRQIDFAGFPPILQLYLKVAAGAADIPVTRLLNDSPSGMQSTGDSDTTNYYDRLAAEQHTDLSPELERGDEMIIRSALGQRPPEVHYNWNPLWQMSDAQKADIRLKRAQTTQIYAGMGLVPDEVLEQGVRNALIESGEFPGIEAAYADYDAKVEAGEIDPDGGDEPTEPPAMRSVAALLAEAGQRQLGGPQGTGPATRAPADARDV